MIKKILGTASTRVLHAGLTFVILFILTRTIKSEGYGTVALIILDMTLIMLLVDLIAGSGLIYFTSRKNIFSLLITSYVWLIVSLLFFVGVEFVLSFFPKIYNFMIPEGYAIHILFFAFINAMNYINFNILMGKEMIKEFNISFMVHIVAVVILLCIFIYGIEFISPLAYFYSVYIAFGISFVLSGYYVLPLLKEKERPQIITNFKEIFQFGIYGQMANGVQMANKRLSYFLISKMMGIPSLGVYSAGVQLTEGLRLIGTSISMVQFSRISNTTDREYAKNLTIQLLKFTVIATALALLVIILIPTSWFVALMDEEFSQVKPIIYSLSIGVLSLAASMIFSHYFSGIGKPKYNTWASSIGAIFTLTLAFILVPMYGFIGAGITTSVAYTASLIYQIIIFKKHTNAKSKDFLLRLTDIYAFKKEITIMIKKKGQD